MTGHRSEVLMWIVALTLSFVATATAVGVIVDIARLPVYLATDGRALLRYGPLILAAAAGAVIGTPLGIRVLARVPERVFRRIVSVLLLVLGVAMIVSGGR